MNPYDSAKHRSTSLPCCRYDHSGTEYYENIDPINKSNTWIKLQEQFLNDKRPKECAHCWRDEEHNIQSYRQIMLETFSDVVEDESYKDKKLRFLELMFGNTCNLACRSCSPTFSSKWGPIYNHMLKVYDINVGTHTPNISFTNWKALDLTNLTQLKIMGGEPFYQKGALELLEHLEKIDVLKNISLTIPTNGTIGLTARWKELLAQTKHNRITISIDSPDQLNDYIREGSSWDEVEKKLEDFYNFAKEYSHKCVLTFNTVVSVYNVNKTKDIQEYFAKRFTWNHYFDIAYYPSYLDCATLPDDIKIKILNTNPPDKIKNYLGSNEFSVDNFNKLKLIIKRLDEYHNKSLRNYNPEMYEWIFQ